MKVLITGATGLIGKALCQLLIADGHQIVILSRRSGAQSPHPAIDVYHWEPEVGLPPAAALKGAEAVVHLAGESVAARRWTSEQKMRIRDSRVIGTRNLVTAIGAMEQRPGALVSASAVGFYGDRGDEELDERRAAGRGFLSEVCEQWEQEAERAASFGLRVVRVRIGVVLSQEGGALPRMLTPFKLGVGGRLGSGRQWFPWIHIDDVVGLIRHALLTPSLSGPVNAAAPGVVTNADLTKALAAVLHRPALFPVPELALRLAMGEMAEVLLGSQRAIPRAALEAGYRFKYPDIKGALEGLFGEGTFAGHKTELSKAKKAH